MNMDNYIQSLIDSGMTLDEVGRELSCALNRKQKEIDEADRKSRELEQHREGLIDNINASIDINHFDYKSAASATIVAMIDQGVVKDKESAEKAFRDIYRSFEPAASPQAEPQSKREDEKIVRYNAGSDTEKILRFLRQLGL